MYSSELERIFAQDRQLREIVEAAALASSLPVGSGVTEALAIGSVIAEAERRQRLAYDTLRPFAAESLIQEEYAKLSMGPLGAFRDTQHFDAALREIQRYDEQFLLPAISQSRELAQMALQGSHLAQQAQQAGLYEALVSSRSQPWMDSKNPLGSATAFADLYAIGYATAVDPFGTKASGLVRDSLGDFRDLDWASVSTDLLDARARTEFYWDRGLDPSLSDFPESAFEEGLLLAGFDPGDESDDEAIAVHVFKLVTRMERRVRTFLIQVMEPRFGGDWIKHRVPGDVIEGWKRKRHADVAAGRRQQRLLDYSEIGDFIKIIERADNWHDVFECVFLRKEDILESFQRLNPVRRAAMHSRVVTRDDRLYVAVEIRRINTAIDQRT